MKPRHIIATVLAVSAAGLTALGPVLINAAYATVRRVIHEGNPEATAEMTGYACAFVLLCLVIVLGFAASVLITNNESEER